MPEETSMDRYSLESLDKLGGYGRIRRHRKWCYQCGKDLRRLYRYRKNARSQLVRVCGFKEWYCEHCHLRSPYIGIFD